MTARADTEVAAANLALGHLGQPAIASLSDANIRARAVKLHFASVRDSLIRDKWWSFSKGWVSPAADATDSIGPLKKRFAMPDDCLRVRYIVDSDGAPFDEESGAWALASGKIDVAGAVTDATIIESNLTAPLVCYTRRIEEVRLWDAVFLDAFAYELASRAARKCGRSATRAAELHSLAAQTIDSASAIDSMEKARPKAPARTSWLDARRGYRVRG